MFSNSSLLQIIPFSWVLANFLLSKAIMCPSYIRTLLIVRPFIFMCASKNFTESKNRSTNSDDNFPFKRSNTLYCSPFHSNEPSFFKRSMSGLTSVKKSFMNFL